MRCDSFTRRVMMSLGVLAAGLVVGGPTAHAAPVQPSWQWLFDEADTNSTTALDTGSAGAAKNGTIVNAGGATGDYRSTLTPFSYSGNRSFIAGSMRKVDAPLNISLGTQSTQSLWVRLDTSFSEVGNSWVMNATGSAGTLTSAWYYGRMGAALGANDNVYWNGKYQGDDNLTHNGAVTALSNGVWRHLVVVRDGADVDIWQGDLGSNLTKVWTLVLPAGSTGATTFNTLSIGSYSAGTGNLFPGQIDEFALWDSALSDSDLAWLHSNSLSAIPEPAGLALLGLALPALLRRRRGA